MMEKMHEVTVMKHWLSNNERKTKSKALEWGKPQTQEMERGINDACFLELGPGVLLPEHSTLLPCPFSQLAFLAAVSTPDSN